MCEKHNGRIGVLTIGPAGENSSAISMAFVDRISTLGRGGFGAVMGSKNLKAIVVKGSSGIKVANRKRFSSINQAVMNSIKEYAYLKEWQDLGMFKAFPMVPLDDYKKIKARRVACVSCPVGCKDVVKIPEGPYAGIEKHTSSAINLLTPMMYGKKNMWESMGMVIKLDNFGLDMFEFFNIMEFAKKLTDSKTIQLQFGENGFKDYLTGKPLTIDQAEKMKLDYYKEWGWET